MDDQVDQRRFDGGEDHVLRRRLVVEEVDGPNLVVQRSDMFGHVSGQAVPEVPPDRVIAFPQAGGDGLRGLSPHSPGTEIQCSLDC